MIVDLCNAWSIRSGTCSGECVVSRAGEVGVLQEFGTFVGRGDPVAAKLLSPPGPRSLGWVSDLS